jgi:hypothetical protein
MRLGPQADSRGVVNREGESAIGSFWFASETGSGEGTRAKMSCGLGGPAKLTGDVAESDSLSSVGGQGLGVRGYNPSGSVRGWGKLRTLCAISYESIEGW